MTLPNIPLTQQQSTASINLWAQREYVACLQAGYGFSAHDSASDGPIWHYKINGQCYSIFHHKYSPGSMFTVKAHTFKVDHLEWIKQCAAAVARVSA